MAYRVTITSSYVWFATETTVYPNAALGEQAVADFNGVAKRQNAPFEATGQEVPDEAVYPTGVDLFQRIVLGMKHVA